MLRDVNLNFSSLLIDANKMFPSQRRVLYEKSIKSSVGQFVGAVTQNDVEESMLEFMPPSVFKTNIADIRDNIGKLSAQEMVNVVYFPNALVSLVVFSFKCECTFGDLNCGLVLVLVEFSGDPNTGYTNQVGI